MSSAMMKHGSPFAEAMASVETLPLEDQAALAEEISKRVASARRDYRGGRVKPGSSTDLIAELRSK